MNNSAMKYRVMRHRASSLQRGFAAIVALVLIAVLATMGGYLVTTSNALQSNAIKDMQGTHAYWAARAGLEWGLTRIATATPATCVGVEAQVLAIEGYNVTVNCTLNAYPEAGNLVRNIFQITSTAQLGNTPGQVGFVERSVRAVFEGGVVGQ